MKLKVASSMWARLRGLLGTTPRGGEVLFIAPCHSIHTFGMAYAIDVAFVDGAGVVLASKRGLPPCRVMRARHAAGVLERACEESAWYNPGDEIKLTIGSAL